MLQVAEKLQEKEFYIRVNSISDPTDAVANDVKYHRRCWVYAQREAEGSDDNDDIQDIVVTSRVISNIELKNMIKSELIDPSDIPLTMKNINLKYINLLMENHHTPVKENYRRYLKQLLSENISDIEFIKPARLN